MYRYTSYALVQGKSMPVEPLSLVQTRLKRGMHSSFCVLLLMLSMMLLAGCGMKTVSVDDPFVATSNVPRSTVYLPDDDGKPLTAAERTAFASTGAFDKNLTTEDMSDVLRHFKNLVHQNRRTVEVTVARANVYIPLLRNVLRENGLPDELAYLPFVESNFNNLALSRSGALGMWQFMPRTGRYYGLDQTTFVDERRNPVLATRSAAKYLGKLNREFNDWHLAVSAYNAGEGKIGRGLTATGAKTFFELRRRDDNLADLKGKMTEENKQYLPRFLAVCKIMRNLELLGFTPLQPSGEVMREVAVQPGTDLLAFTRELGMSWDTFMEFNAGYLRYIAPPDAVTFAYVPAAMEGSAVAWLRNAPRKGPEYARMRAYTVQPGDTLTSIARKHGLSVDGVARANPGLASLMPGQPLLLPPAKEQKAVAKKSGKQTTKPKAVAKVSGKQDKEPKAVAQTSRKQDTRLAPPPARSAAQKGGQKSVAYQVQQGDTLWAIARKFNVPPHDLLAFNNMTTATKLQPGDVVKVVKN